jgi:hypothetical protein
MTEKDQAMKDGIKKFINNWLTKEEQIARVEKQLKDYEFEVEGWTYALKVLKGEIIEEEEMEEI